MKQKILILLFMIGSFELLAQQDPQFSQYMFNPMALNPAYAGSREALSAVLLHRSQWIGISGAPMTESFAIHAPVWKKKIGLGLGVINDNLGPNNNFEVYGAYAYRVRLGAGKLGMALRTALYNYRFDWSKLEFKDPNEIYYPDQLTSSWLLSFDAGLYYTTNTFYAGLAVNHINQPWFGLQDPNAPADSAYYGAGFFGHSALTFGKAFELTEKFLMKPSIMIQTVNASEIAGKFEASVAFLYDNKLWLGISARMGTGFVFMTEYNISDRFRLGYSYDLNLNALSTQTSGSHEVFIGFDLALNKQKILSPRYF
ncbi:MAG: type IX secretion system membrane protein PorP/SprF [Flavobacteriales bacterium]